MLKRLSEILLNQALRTTASWLRGAEDRIIARWLASLVDAAPGYRVALDYAERWGRENFSLFLVALDTRTPEESEVLRARVLEMAGRVAKSHLERRFALDDILRAYALLRETVLNEVERMLRRRLWLAFPQDILRAEDRINEALDLQMLASAQAYINERDDEIRRGNAALRESNAQLLCLIQEMHHRIKNNLQTVADLLSLEMLQGAKTSAEDRLRESISRVKTIAAVHELLSIDNSELTDIRVLAQKLIDTSARTLADPQKAIDFTVAGPSILLGSKRATALAIVINELINNALEHAFKGRQGGQIAVKLSEDRDGIEVVVRDDGVGLPTGFGDGRARTGLGLQIARTMVTKDLNGRLELVTNGGTTARVRFPV
ncbi:MAG: sensor histidine kinase [Chloroflexota bacterium]